MSTEIKGGMLSSNPQFKSFASSIDYGIIVGCADGKIVDFNDAALKIFGWDETLRGMPITTIMPERFRKMHDAGMNRYNVTKQPKNLGKALHLYGQTKAGEEFPLEISLSSWKDTDGTQYFTASMRKYSMLEDRLKWIIGSAAVMSAAMLAVLIFLAVRTF